MPTSLALDTSRGDDGKLVLSAVGEIDLSNIETFEEALATAISASAPEVGTVTVDLSAVEYLDSAAINALFARASHIDIVAHPLLVPILTMSGLTELVSVESRG